MSAHPAQGVWNTQHGDAFLYCAVNSPVGWCGLCSRGRGLWRSTQGMPSARAALAALEFPAGAREVDDDPLLVRAAEWLLTFPTGAAPRDPFPLDMDDLTDFTRAVLLQCATIPAGQVMSYAALATRIGRPGAARAVGQALGRNPLAPFVPCHRVVGADGSLTGFSGGLALKARILELEGWKVKRGPTGKLHVDLAARPLEKR